MAIAFFDLDKTLLAVNSGTLWVRHELAAGHVSRWQALMASSWILRYHLGAEGLEGVVTQAIASLEGSHAEPVRQRTQSFYQRHVRPLFRPGGRAAIAHHRRRGDRLVLLTSSSNYMAEQVADEFQLDAVLCNELEVDTAGRHTGRTVGAVCFGEGKFHHAQRFARTSGEVLADCAFYTDSYSDVSVMRVVGQAVAVNPDHRLRREAMRRGWPVVDWGIPQLPTR